MWQKEINLTPRNKRFNGQNPSIKRKMLFQLSTTVFFLLLIYFYILPDDKPQFIAANNQSIFLYHTNFESKRDLPSKEQVLVTTTGTVQIPTDILGEDNQMFFTRGGSGFPYFFMTGDDVKDSNSVKVWKHNFEILNELGSFYAVDMINYGNSSPGPKTKKRHILEDEHAKFYSYFITNQLNIPEKRTVLIARGKSVPLTIKAASLIESKIAGIILIAPVSNHELNYKIKNIPILLVWGKDDTIVPFEKANEIENDCNYVTTLFFDQIAQPGVNRSLAHQPDLMRNVEFYNGVKNWIQNLKTR